MNILNNFIDDLYWIAADQMSSKQRTIAPKAPTS